jgi:hypothetical protein
MQVLGVQYQKGDDILTVMHNKLVSLGSTLLVLDNFETCWVDGSDQTEVGNVLARLASIETVSLIVTMRGSAPHTG